MRRTDYFQTSSIPECEIDGDHVCSLRAVVRRLACERLAGAAGHIVVPFVAGGNTDMMARLAAERLAAKFHHPFVIENLGGAGGVTAAAQVARSAPDGYMFLFGAGSQLTLAPLVQKITYDPDKD